MLYTACLRDFAILSEYRLDTLLTVLGDLLGAEEDCAVWYGARVVCVVRGPGLRVTWLAPEHQPAAA